MLVVLIMIGTRRFVCVRLRLSSLSLLNRQSRCRGVVAAVVIVPYEVHSAHVSMTNNRIRRGIETPNARRL